MKKASDILEVRESILYNKNVDKDIKIASVGDIHISKTVGERDINNICESLANEKPDYVCLLGDLIDSPKELIKGNSLDNLENLIKYCSSIAPTMIVLGNHDYICNDSIIVPDLSDESNIWGYINKLSNVYVLNDEVYSDNKIVIGGYIQKEDVYNNRYDKHTEDAIALYIDLIQHPNLHSELRKDLPRVFLAHSPGSIHDNRIKSLLSVYDVIITGHYHNGCVPAMLEDILPKNTGIITSKLELFPKYARGVVKLDTGTYLVYSGGWVKLSASSPLLFHPLDKLCNRQIDITTLTSDEEYKKESIKTKKLILKKWS